MDRRTFLTLAGAGVVLSAADLAAARRPATAGSKASAPVPAPRPRATAGGLGPAFTLPNWSDAGGWTDPSQYATMQLGDINGDGRNELIGRDPSGILVWAFDPTYGQWNPLNRGPELSNASGWDLPQYYSTVQLGDIDGDGQAELIVRGALGIIAYHYDASADTWSVMPGPLGLSDANRWDQPQYYSTIQLGDIDGDGRAELIARGADGIIAYRHDGSGWASLGPGPALSDGAGWDKPQYYSTIQLGDINGDGHAELVARAASGIVAYHYTGSGWGFLRPGPGLSDAEGWDKPQYYSTIQLGDVDGDGQVELIARGGGGLATYKYGDPAWSHLASGPAFTDAAGWDLAQYYTTIQLADIDGDGQAELIARGAAGILAYHYGSGAWTALPSGAALSDAGGWDRAGQYSTIQFGDVDGDKQAELIGRDVPGVRTWRWAAQGFASPSATFPPFTGKALDAYTYINTALGVVDIRSEYGAVATTLQSFYDSLSTLKAPNGISKHTWKSVRHEIEDELTAALAVAGYFQSAQSVITETFLSKDLTLDYVATTLEIDQKSNDKIEALFFNLGIMLAGILGGVLSAGALSAVAGTIAAGVFAAVQGALSTGLGFAVSSKIEQDYANLTQTLAGNFQSALDGNAANQEAAAGDYGLLYTMSNLVKGGPWTQNPDILAQSVAAARMTYEIWLWQTLSPQVMEIGYCKEGANCLRQAIPRWNWGDSHAVYWPIKKGGDCLSNPSSTALDHLFGQPDSKCQATYSAGDCTLGVPLSDFFLGRNGWNLHQHSCDF